MNTINRDINKLDSNFRNKIIAFLSEAKQKGFDIMVFEWFRTLERQKELYAQWRTKPGKKVTWTMQSKHLSWQAVDIVFKDSKWNPTWNWDYDSLIPIAKKYWINNLKPTETCHFECDWILFLTKEIMGEFEKMFKEKYKKSSVFNDTDWAVNKCIDKNWNIIAKEFFYLVMIWLERVRK